MLQARSREREREIITSCQIIGIGGCLLGNRLNDNLKFEERCPFHRQVDTCIITSLVTSAQSLIWDLRRKDL
jgi:hypothetical protein